jgi:hypothetical protein
MQTSPVAGTAHSRVHGRLAGCIREIIAKVRVYGKSMTLRVLGLLLIGGPE